MLNQERALIKRFKKQIGPIALLDCSHVDTINAHRLLGVDAHDQIHKTLARRLDDLGDRNKVLDFFELARKSRQALQKRLDSYSLPDNLRDSIQVYQECISAWAQGADLAGFQHPLLDKTMQGSAAELELASILQADEVGCQTGVFREANGAVILWHTEEDYEDDIHQRFDKLRLFFFKAAGGQRACSFIYPDLLPGPTFGWQENGFAQAVDTLHVRPFDADDAILPNLFAWISLYLGNKIRRGELAARIGPFKGGYSLTGITPKTGQVQVEKVEIANGKFVANALDDLPGSALCQTNIIQDLSQDIGTEELTKQENRSWNENRLTRVMRFVQKIQKSQSPLLAVKAMIRSHQGGESAFANRDVKAHFICQISETSMSIEVGPGAAEYHDNTSSKGYQAIIPFPAQK